MATPTTEFVWYNKLIVNGTFNVNVDRENAEPFEAPAFEGFLTEDGRNDLN